MKKTLLILFLLLLMICFSGSALAAANLSMYVQPASSSQDTVAPEAVTLFKKNATTFYLFMPAGFDATNLRVIYTGADSITIDDQELLNGQTTGIFAQLVGQTAKLKYGSKSVKLHVMQSAYLNALCLTTESGTVQNIEKKKGLKETGTYAVFSPEGKIDKNGNLNYIRGRGNGSFMYSKKPYEIELESKENMFGMGKAKRWLLISNHIDYTLIRNKIAYDTACEIGMEYAIRSNFVDLYINHEYRGCYLMTEKVEIGSNRVDINDLNKATKAVNDKALSEYKTFGMRNYKANIRKGYEIPNDPEDITGGYLVELELSYRYRYEPSGIVTQKGQPIIIKQPKYASRAQVDYIGDMLQGLENALFSSNGIDPKTGKHWYEYIDRDSYVTLYVLQETLKNYDANRSSLFLYKPEDSVSTLLKAGPAWDFDQSLDNYGFLGGKVNTVTTSSTNYHWFPKAYKLQEFKDDATSIYVSKLRPCLAILLGETEHGTYLRSIDEYAEEIKASSVMNFARWGYTTTSRYTRTGRNHDESLTKLKSFLVTRRTFLNKFWGAE